MSQIRQDYRKDSDLNEIQGWEQFEDPDLMDTGNQQPYVMRNNPSIQPLQQFCNVQKKHQVVNQDPNSIIIQQQTSSQIPNKIVLDSEQSSKIRNSSTAATPAINIEKCQSRSKSIQNHRKVVKNVIKNLITDDQNQNLTQIQLNLSQDQQSHLSQPQQIALQTEDVGCGTTDESLNQDLNITTTNNFTQISTFNKHKYSTSFTYHHKKESISTGVNWVQSQDNNQIPVDVQVNGFQQQKIHITQNKINRIVPKYKKQQSITKREDISKFTIDGTADNQYKSLMLQKSGSLNQNNNQLESNNVLKKFSTQMNNTQFPNIENFLNQNIHLNNPENPSPLDLFLNSSITNLKEKSQTHRDQTNNSYIKKKYPFSTNLIHNKDLASSTKYNQYSSISPKIKEQPKSSLQMLSSKLYLPSRMQNNITQLQYETPTHLQFQQNETVTNFKNNSTNYKRSFKSSRAMNVSNFNLRNLPQIEKSQSLEKQYNHKKLQNIGEEKYIKQLGQRTNYITPQSIIEKYQSLRPTRGKSYQLENQSQNKIYRAATDLKQNSIQSYYSKTSTQNDQSHQIMEDELDYDLHTTNINVQEYLKSEVIKKNSMKLSGLTNDNKQFNVLQNYQLKDSSFDYSQITTQNNSTPQKLSTQSHYLQNQQQNNRGLKNFFSHLVTHKRPLMGMELQQYLQNQEQQQQQNQSLLINQNNQFGVLNENINKQKYINNSNIGSKFKYNFNHNKTIVDDYQN